jgi:hypothetical protein
MKIDPAKLWGMPNSQRPQDILGSTAAIATGSPSVAYLSVAKGNRAAGPFIALEQRATIRAAIAVMQQLGKTSANADALHSGLVQSVVADDALTKAAGGGSLSVAADRMRHKIASMGKNAAKAAWGFRGLYILKSYAGVGAAEATAAVAVNVIPVAGQIVSAILGVKSTAEGAVLAKAATDFQAMAKSGIMAAPQDIPHGGARALTRAMPAPVVSQTPTAVYVAGAAATVIAVSWLLWRDRA